MCIHGNILHLFTIQYCKKRGVECVKHPPKLDQTRISMPLSDTFLETVDINLPNDQIKNGCLSLHYFLKFKHKVRPTKNRKKNLTIIAGPMYGMAMQIRTVIQKTAYITDIT